MAQYVGRPVRFTALPAVHVEGRAVVFRAPRAFYAYLDAEGNAQPVRLGTVTETGIEWLTPPI